MSYDRKQRHIHVAVSVPTDFYFWVCMPGIKFWGCTAHFRGAFPKKGSKIAVTCMFRLLSRINASVPRSSHLADSRKLPTNFNYRIINSNKNIHYQTQ